MVKLVLKCGAGFLALLLLLTAVGVWRLSQGPVSAGMLAGPSETAINHRIYPWRAAVGGVQLAWDTQNRRIRLSLSDIRLKTPPGEADEKTILLIPSLTLSFAPGWGLLAMQPDIEHLTADLTGAVPNNLAAQIPALKGINMTVSGRVTVMFSGGAPVGGNARFAASGDIADSAFLPPVSNGWARLNAAIDPDSSGISLDGSLRQGGGREATLSGRIGLSRDPALSINNLNLDVRDLTLQNPDAVGPLLLGKVRLDADIKAAAGSAHIREFSVETGGGRVEISGDVLDAPGSPALDLTGGISDLSVADVVRLWPAPVADGARNWVAANVVGGIITDADIRMTVDGGELAQTGPGKPLDNDRLSLKFRVEEATFHYRRPMPPMRNVSAWGHLQGDRFDIRADAADIPIPSGDIEVSDVHFETSGFSMKNTPGAVRMEFTASTESMLGFISGEPLNALRNADIDPADTGGAVNGELSLALPLNRDVKMEEIILSVSGEAHGLRGPLPGTPWRISGGDPEFSVDNAGFSVSGPVDINNIPLTVDWRQLFANGAITVGAIALAGSTELERLGIGGGISINPSANPYQNAIIDLTLKSDGDHLTDGTISADLAESVLAFPMVGVVKPADSAADLTTSLVFDSDGAIHLRDLSLTGAALDMEGEISFDSAGELQAMNARAGRLGVDNSFDLTVKKRDDGALLWNADGQRMDARAIITDLLGDDDDAIDASLPEADPDESGEAGPGRRTVMEGRFNNIVAHGGVFLKDVGFSAESMDNSLLRLTMSGQFNDEAGIKVSFEPAPSPESGRVLQVEAADGGAFLRGLDLYENIRGGVISITATAGPVGGDIMLEGAVNGGGFHVVNAPVFADLLTLGSLTGIRDTLEGSGIFFRRLHLPFRMDADAIHIENGSMTGPAVGLSIDGTVDRITGVAELNGVISPAYTLNAILAEIPLIGPIFGGEEGEGTFGITYQISGPLDDPRILTNPLSLFAPGVFRNLFGFSEGDAEANERNSDDN